MERDCGWVGVLPLDADAAAARGRLLIEDSLEGGDVQAAPVLQATATSPQEDEEFEWRGRIESLKTDDELITGDRYQLHFEANDELREVRIDSVDNFDDQTVAHVVSTDGQLPAVWVELGGH